MAVKLKDETILNQWSMLIDGAADRGNEVLDDIQARLTAARIPGNCAWDVEEVESGGMFSKTKREFLIVRLDQFSDYRNYISVRAYGTHLDCCRFLTVELLTAEGFDDHLPADGVAVHLIEGSTALRTQTPLVGLAPYDDLLGVGESFVGMGWSVSIADGWRATIQTSGDVPTVTT